MLGRTDSRRRLILLLVAFVMAAGALVVRLAYWQVVRGVELRGQAVGRSSSRVEESLQRGDIVDRSGRVVLATTGYRDRLIAFPELIPPGERQAVARELVRVLALDAAAARALTKTISGGGPYAVLARQLTIEQSEQVRAGLAAERLAGLELEPRAVRVYPNPGGSPGTSLASHLLGFVNSEGKGQYGIEQQHHERLAGRPRVSATVAGATQVLDEGTPGGRLRLSIDASLQLQVEKEAYAAWVADAAESVSIVVMEPDTGEVLAWASAPGYDANRYQEVARTAPGRFADPIVAGAYEPGSVMKILLAAAALEQEVVSAGTLINDTPSVRYGEHRVDNADKKGRGRIPFRDVIAHSRNVGVARVAAQLGPDTQSAARVLYGMWDRLGIGKRTGIDIAGEAAGTAADPDRKPWAAVDLANRSFGQAVATTPIQLATAYSAMVNGGRLVRPHVIADVPGRPVRARSTPQVIAPALSSELQGLMVHVVTGVERYAAGTVIPGYLVGGKTGTAQVWDSANGQWFPDRYQFSFVGFVGQDRPRAVIAVRIGPAKPSVRRQGEFKLAITSYELFRRVGVQVIRSLDLPRARPSAPGIAVGHP